MASTFVRTGYTRLKIQLTSSESMGILDTSFIEDLDGNNGRVTLFHLESQTRYVVLMSATSDRQLFGWFDLEGKPNGRYWVEARVRDVLGNYTVFGWFQQPQPTANITSLSFEIVSSLVQRCFCVSFQVNPKVRPLAVQPRAAKFLECCVH